MSCHKLGLKVPRKPRPIFSYIPLASKLKVKENDGFDLGEDNCIKSIQIRNQSLHIEMSSILRPGRFLGSHYLAFSVPNRTFIITLDRVKQSIRAARKAKQLLTLQRKERALIARGELDLQDAQYVDHHEEVALRLEAERVLNFEEAPPPIERGPIRYPQTLLSKHQSGFPQAQHQWPNTNAVNDSNDGNDGSGGNDGSKTTPMMQQASPLVKTMVVKRENVFSRFVRGYMSASQDYYHEEQEHEDMQINKSNMKKKNSRVNSKKKDEEWNDRLTFALSEWFGRQEIGTSPDTKRLTLRDFKKEGDAPPLQAQVQPVPFDLEAAAALQTEIDIDQNLAKEAFEKLLPVVLKEDDDDDVPEEPPRFGRV
jgi:hypothetical protein